MKFYKMIILIILFVGCQKSKVQSIKITKESFLDIKKLKGEQIEIKGLLDPFRYHLIRDTLVIVENNQTDDNYFELFNIKTKQKILEFGQRGKGPNELLSAQLLNNSSDSKNNNSQLFVYDVVKRRLSEYNIDSLMRNGSQKKIKTMDFPSSVKSFTYMENNKFICYNSFFLESADFYNDTEEVFFYSEKDNLSGPDISNCKFFVSNVTGANILYSAEHNKILVANTHLNKLDFYGKDLELKKSIIGPETAKPEYTFLEKSKMVKFKRGRSFYSYGSGVVSNNSIYIIYTGAISYRFDRPNTLPQVEVFKLDWNGNLIKRFVLDKFIFTISLSNDEKYLYGTSINNKGEIILIKYNLI
ncbi:BF3164 family lipoprotein [Snuella lapsa]|uniref:TolB-like 6-blade propeller-like n=1 Tax=Snuella lapsa TaxID=870481 RepID=A0ABP6WYP0_9FLAO